MKVENCRLTVEKLFDEKRGGHESSTCGNKE
jgi:hypothetical protein